MCCSRLGVQQVSLAAQQRLAEQRAKEASLGAYHHGRVFDYPTIFSTTNLIKPYIQKSPPASNPTWIDLPA